MGWVLSVSVAGALSHADTLEISCHSPTWVLLSVHKLFSVLGEFTCVWYFQVFALFFTSQFLVSSLRARSVRKNTRARVTICTIHSLMSSFTDCNKTKEIYDSMNFPCIMFMRSLNFGNVLYFNNLLSGEGGWFVIFRIFKCILFFINWISLFFFYFL